MFLTKLLITPSLLLWYSARDVVKHYGVEYAGYLAFLSILSIFPFLIFTTCVLRWVTGFFPINNNINEILSSITVGIPPEMLSGIEPRINEILKGPPVSLLTLAAINIIWTSSSIIEGIRTFLDIAFRSIHIRPYFLRRFFSILQFIFLSTFITLFAMIATTISLIGQFVANAIHLQTGELFQFPLGITSLVVMLIMLYRILPHTKCSMSSIFIGSTFVTLCWMISAKLFVIFLYKFSQLSVIYGSVGGIIISLIFFYVLALFFIFGAEFIYHIDNMHRKTTINQNVKKYSEGH